MHSDRVCKCDVKDWIPRHLLTNSGSLSEEFIEASVAVGLVVLLLEGAFIELPQAEGADEVLGVELAEHGRDAPAGYGLVAARAQWAALPVVVRLAVRLTLVLEEWPAVEWLAAFL